MTHTTNGNLRRSPSQRVAGLSRASGLLRWLLTLAWVAVALLAVHAQGAPGENAPPPSVIVDPARVRDISEQWAFTGRVEAIDKVSIRARIAGFLKSRGFEEAAVLGVFLIPMLYVVFQHLMERRGAAKPAPDVGGVSRSDR